MKTGIFRLLLIGYGISSLSGELKEYCATMIEIFNDLQKSTPNIKFSFIS